MTTASILLQGRTAIRMEEEFYRLRMEERVALVREAIAAGRPLMARWAKIASDFGELWRRRAKTAAEWLTGAGSVADLECGGMTLERYLDIRQRYIPVDLARRDDRSVVLDVNEPADLARLPDADACALLGVLEYSYAPEDLANALRNKYRQAIVSYNLSSNEQDVESRLSNGWVTHFDRDQLYKLFADHDFALVRAHVIEARRRECLFEFRRAER